MTEKLNLDQWARKEHFHFFRKFEEPFFGVCVEMDCTRAYAYAKETGASFFLYTLFQSLVAANRIEPFRYRIREEEVWVYSEVHASPTINRPDGTFGFSYLDYHPEFSVFQEKARKEIEEVRKSRSLVPAVSGENVIHYSSLPWIHFTQFSLARSFSFPDSAPKICFGKMITRNKKRIMPVSVHVHHALMDGFHVGEFLALYEELLKEK